MDDKTVTSIGSLLDRLSELSANVTVLQWGMMADDPFRRPKRKPTDTVGSLIAWLRRFPKKTKIEQFVIRMEDELKYPMLMEFGLKETLQYENHINDIYD